jgi:hypothetical protein
LELRCKLVLLTWNFACLFAGCGDRESSGEVRLPPDGGHEVLPPAVPQKDDWPWWRGPTHDGKSDATGVPFTWSESQNILWKAPVPGRGHSTPSIWGERIFLATADETEETQSVLAYDRRSGARLWERVAHRGNFAPKHQKNSHASATPAADGERVYVPFLNDKALFATALDHGGNIIWQTKVGAFTSQHGYGSSPVLYKSVVIVSGDSQKGSFIAALHRKTGKVLWRTPRGDNPNYATPIVGDVAGRPQLLLHGAGTVSSYDPDSGERLWFCEGPCEVAACTIAFGPELVYASGGYPDKNLLAIRADGSGDVTSTRVAWKVAARGVTYVPSPVLHEGHLYVVKDDGIATCFEASTGKVVWTERLGGAFSASPALAAGHFFVPNESGVTYVFKAAPVFDLVAQNDLGDGGFASPVICGGKIYLRTNHNLYCIAKSGTAG